MINRPDNQIDFFDFVNNLLADLPQRSQDIIRKRFGLGGEKSETLEKIGRDYGITRERVRQIVFDAIKNICNQKDKPEFQKAEERIIFTIEKNNGIIKETDIVKQLGKNDFQEENAVNFFVNCLKSIHIVSEKGIMEKSWMLSRNIVENVKKTNLKAQEILEKEKKPLTDEEILEKLLPVVSDMNKEQLLSCLKVLKKIIRNKFGKWGIYHWPEISPKGTREKIFLILKEEKKPLHFTQIAALIDKYALGKRKAHPQTVHNELIKDKRFVLIGRGIYALREWGYSEGTIKDVIKNILERNNTPLNKEQILSEVFKIRKVKKATVMINLNNQQVFEKHNNSYSVKK